MENFKKFGSEVGQGRPFVAFATNIDKYFIFGRRYMNVCHIVFDVMIENYSISPKEFLINKRSGLLDNSFALAVFITCPLSSIISTLAPLVR